MPVFVQRKFARGQQADFVDGINAALRIDIEGADRIDFIAKQIDAIRDGAAGRKQIDKPTAHRVFARCHHLRGVRVAGCDEIIAQTGDVEPRFYLQEKRSAGEILARTQSRHCGRHRYDADVELSLRKLIQGREPFRREIRVRRELIVGQRFPIGQTMHPQRRREPANFLAQPFRIERVGGQNK